MEREVAWLFVRVKGGIIYVKQSEVAAKAVIDRVQIIHRIHVS